MPPKWNEKDNEKNDTYKGETKEAWHTARDDAEKSGDLQRGSPSGSGGRSGESGGRSGSSGQGQNSGGSKK